MSVSTVAVSAISLGVAYYTHRALVKSAVAKAKAEASAFVAVVKSDVAKAVAKVKAEVTTVEHEAVVAKIEAEIKKIL